MQRRLFIQSVSSLLATGILTGFPDLLKALAEQPVLPSDLPKFFVLIIVGNGNGGMDVIQGLDPWYTPRLIKKPNEQDLFIDYLGSDIIQSSGLYLGPSAKALAPFLSQSVIVNGIVVSENDNGHDAALTYMTTGSGGGTKPHWSVDMALQGQKSVIGLVTNASAKLFDRNITLSSTQDVINSLDGEDLISILSEQVQTQTNSAFLDSQRILSDNSGLFLKAKGFLKSQKDKGVSLAAEHALVASFISGLSRTGMIELQPDGNLDSHQDYAKNHNAAQTSVWNKVAGIFKLFQNTQLPNSTVSLFDRTTFAVVSEFSRTPALNKANGKDHNPNTNSVLITGYGIKKPMVLGESSLRTREMRKQSMSMHMGAPVDPKTGQAVYQRGKGAKFIRPENVLKTIGLIAGVESAKLDQVMPDVWTLPLSP